MSIPDLLKRDSTISLSSSWTLINDSTISESGSQECFNIEGDSDIDKQHNRDLHTNSVCSLLIDPNDDSLQENIQKAHIPEPHKSKRKKKKRLQQRKHEVEVLSFLSIAACILTITGITLLTNIISENIHNDSINQIHENYLDTITATSPDTNLSKLFNKTQNVVKLADDIDLFNIMDKFVMDASNFEDETCNMFDNIFNKSHAEQFGPQNYDSELPLTNTSFIRRSLEKSKEFLSSTASMLLKSPGFQIMLATILQDICLIKLVRDFSKSKNKKDDVAMYQVQQHIAAKKPQKKLKKKSNLKREKQNLNKTQQSDTKIINEINTRYNNNNHAKDTKENGKSECERRFEELDTEWKVIGHNHRQKIQEIKDTFQKEIVQIKQDEKETVSRRKRISLTREKYIQRLQMDRENFLHELRKVREERQKLLGQICQQKLQNRTGSSKDASVGNYAVLLPGSFDFQQKLQMLKDKEHHHEPFNFEIKKTESKSQDSNGSLRKKEKILNNTVRFKETATKVYQFPNKYSDVKRKYFKKHANMLRKQEKVADQRPHEIKQGILRITENVSQPNNTEMTIYNPMNDRSLGKIYKAAFDKDGEKIQKLDMLRWNKSRRLQRKNEVLGKQNRTAKTGKKEKITFKGPL